QDLKGINRALLKINDLKFVLVGAAGLANALEDTFYLTTQHALPVLVIAGSMSTTTQQQIHFAIQSPYIDCIKIDVKQLISQANALQDYAQQATKILQKSHHCILQTCDNEQARHKIESLCEQLQINRQQ